MQYLEKSGDTLSEYGKVKKYAALVCQADETYFLMNGSSSGIFSAIFSATKKNGEMIMARNCPKAVYHGAGLRQIRTHYLYPELLPEGIFGGINVEMAEEAFEKYPEAKTLILTSPTFEGVVSDVNGIVKAAHAKGVTVIVDETYGGHFLKESGFPKSAVRCGADVVIQRIDKSLPQLPQTILVHVHKDYKYKEKLKKYLKIFQCEEPSNVQIQSVDHAMNWYVEEGRESFKKYLGNLKKLRAAMTAQLENLKLLTLENVFDHDISKVVISTRETGISGKELHKKLLEKHHFQADLACMDYVVFTTSVSDKEQDYGHFLEAVFKIDGEFEKTSPSKIDEDSLGNPKALMSIYEAVEKNRKSVSLPDSMGEVSASYVWIDPPGIMLLTPGEKISERCVRCLENYLEEGLEVCGLTKEKEIEVVWEEFFT